MSAWYSNILTTTTSRINNLQRTFLGGETDGDTEDDTHVCRVLRQYYTEKGRPFPGWLPPDPKAPPPVQPVLAQPGQQQGGGSLSSLWDSNPVSQPQDAQSLRRGRGAPPPIRQSDPRLNPFGRNSDPMGGGREDVQARPLPSQRAGSYQTTGVHGRDNQTPPGSSAGGGSAQDRLRQRLWGGSRTASPSSSSPFNPPAQQSNLTGGGGGGDYEDRFAPGGLYDSNNRGGNDRPFMAANSPWASSEQDYSGGAGGGRSAGGSAGGPRRGLPSGPRMR
ncbi:Sec1-binding region of Mso1-domain-containing protein [Pseudomassariella vexata]|uniref:Sec1-binding region of Mso1-domain-containing protein n=1 Tax=Pseudomassariella vexata TaxID=1141098 RepID=A0A1Y2EJ39_9PEZI|nr:Sec1-binding region of Mso1-domain-containing protein [Pseudomassariella vexata]ORY71560.1 Sec1-binding region of Mso1-domain-containing protein [Pseudomassariella vexata]